MDTSMLTKSQVSANNIYISATKHFFINVITKFAKSNLTAGLSVMTSALRSVMTSALRTVPKKSDKTF